MPVGFLVVFSETGAEVTTDEFQDWYNNEHVPLRLNHLPSFLTGARYSASDEQKPSWLALYDIDDTSTFQHESYTRLRANRSPREANLVKRLEILDRRTCEFVYDSGESELTTSLGSNKPTPILYTHGLTGGSSECLTWVQSNFEEMKGVDGWVRSRAFRCFDNLTTGTAVGSTLNAQVVPPYFILHEFVSLDIVDVLPIIRKDSVPVVSEERSWMLYRAYPSISQGNVSK